MDILNDVKTYRKLTFDLTMKFTDTLKNIIVEGVSLGIVSDKLGKFLCPQTPGHAIFHGLPKVH